VVIAPAPLLVLCRPPCGSLRGRRDRRNRRGASSPTCPCGGGGRVRGAVARRAPARCRKPIVTFAGTGAQALRETCGPPRPTPASTQPGASGIAGSGPVSHHRPPQHLLHAVVRASRQTGRSATVAGGGSSTADGVPRTQDDMPFIQDVEPTADGGYMLAEYAWARPRPGAEGRRRRDIRTVAATATRRVLGDAPGPAPRSSSALRPGWRRPGDGTFLDRRHLNHPRSLVNPVAPCTHFAAQRPGRSVGGGGGFAGDGGLATAARLNSPLESRCSQSDARADRRQRATPRTTGRQRRHHHCRRCRRARRRHRRQRRRARERARLQPYAIAAIPTTAFLSPTCAPTECASSEPTARSDDQRTQARPAYNGDAAAADTANSIPVGPRRVRRTYRSWSSTIQPRVRFAARQ